MAGVLPSPLSPPLSPPLLPILPHAGGMRRLRGGGTAAASHSAARPGRGPSHCLVSCAGNVVEYVNETHHIDYDTEFDNTSGTTSTTVSTMTHEEHNITFIPVRRRRPLLYRNHAAQLSPRAC